MWYECWNSQNHEQCGSPIVCNTTIKVTSSWARWRFKSPASRLFTQSFRRRSKKTSKLRVTCLCEGNPPVTGGFPSQRTIDAENVSIWWHRHDMYVSGFPPTFWLMILKCLSRKRPRAFSNISYVERTFLFYVTFIAKLVRLNYVQENIFVCSVPRITSCIQAM